MAYPGYGAFLPAEALYTEPGAYSGVLRGEALKRASYLSEMDRFYEELRESSERFEKQYALAERELSFTEEQALWEREFTEEQAEKQEGIEEKRFEHETSLARIGASAQKSAGKWQYELGLKQLDLQREIEKEQLSEREEWDIASDYLSKIMPPTSITPPASIDTGSAGRRTIAPIVSDRGTTEIQTISPPKLDRFGYKIY
jgi:hypothetical protein